MRTRAYSGGDPYGSDALLLDELAHLRWGPTGFRCERCSHTRAWISRTRPRVRTCAQCRHPTSVTAGTLLHATQLPIAYWAERGELFETAARIPTCTELAYDLAISRATAWLLNQKMFRLAETTSRVAIQGAAFFLAAIRVRRPRPTPPMAETAPPHVQRLHTDHRQRRIHPVSVDITIHVTDDTLWVDRVAPSRSELDERRRSPPNWRQEHDFAGLHRWLRVRLVVERHTVSLRWLPRWLQATMLLWRRGHVNPPRWDLAAIRCAACPLRRLDPWNRDRGS